MWLSLVERSVRDAEVVGSNPAIPTNPHNNAACLVQTALLLSVPALPGTLLPLVYELFTDIYPMFHRCPLF